MTAVLAIDFFYQITVIADCRVSWRGGSYKPQDNLQKIYPFGPTGVLAFSGDLRPAKTVFQKIRDEASKLSLPPSATMWIPLIQNWAKNSYSRLPQPAKGPLEIMYAASDYGNVSAITDNVIFAKNLMVKLTAPEFDPNFEREAVRLGYAIKYPLDNIIKNRNNMLSLGLTDAGKRLLSGIMFSGFAKNLVSYSPTEVGGMFVVGIIDARGIQWIPYSIKPLELTIENGKFVQYDHSNGRRIPLKHIWEFDPRKPDVGNLMFNT